MHPYSAKKPKTVWEILEHVDINAKSHLYILLEEEIFMILRDLTVYG